MFSGGIEDFGKVVLILFGISRDFFDRKNNDSLVLWKIKLFEFLIYDNGGFWDV